MSSSNYSGARNIFEQAARRLLIAILREDYASVCSTAQSLTTAIHTHLVLRRVPVDTSSVDFGCVSASLSAYSNEASANGTEARGGPSGRLDGTSATTTTCLERRALQESELDRSMAAAEHRIDEVLGINIDSTHKSNTRTRIGRNSGGSESIVSNLNVSSSNTLNSNGSPASISLSEEMDGMIAAVQFSDEIFSILFLSSNAYGSKEVANSWLSGRSVVSAAWGAMQRIKSAFTSSSAPDTSKLFTYMDESTTAQYGNMKDSAERELARLIMISLISFNTYCSDVQILGYVVLTMLRVPPDPSGSTSPLKSSKRRRKSSAVTTDAQNTNGEAAAAVSVISVNAAQTASLLDVQRTFSSCRDLVQAVESTVTSQLPFTLHCAGRQLENIENGSVSVVGCPLWSLLCCDDDEQSDANAHDAAAAGKNVNGNGSSAQSRDASVAVSGGKVLSVTSNDVYVWLAVTAALFGVRRPYALCVEFNSLYAQRVENAVFLRRLSSLLLQCLILYVTQVDRELQALRRCEIRLSGANIDTNETAAGDFEREIDAMLNAYLSVKREIPKNSPKRKKDLGEEEEEEEIVPVLCMRRANATVRVLESLTHVADVVHALLYADADDSGTARSSRERIPLQLFTVPTTLTELQRLLSLLTTVSFCTSIEVAGVDASQAAPTHTARSANQYERKKLVHVRRVYSDFADRMSVVLNRVSSTVFCVSKPLQDGCAGERETYFFQLIPRDSAVSLLHTIVLHAAAVISVMSSPTDALAIHLSSSLFDRSRAYISSTLPSLLAAAYMLSGTGSLESSGVAAATDFSAEHSTTTGVSVRRILTSKQVGSMYTRGNAENSSGNFEVLARSLRATSSPISTLLTTYMQSPLLHPSNSSYGNNGSPLMDRQASSSPLSSSSSSPPPSSPLASTTYIEMDVNDSSFTQTLIAILCDVFLIYYNYLQSQQNVVECAIMEMKHAKPVQSGQASNRAKYFNQSAATGTPSQNSINIAQFEGDVRSISDSYLARLTEAAQQTTVNLCQVIVYSLETCERLPIAGVQQALDENGLQELKSFVAASNRRLWGRKSGKADGGVEDSAKCFGLMRPTPTSIQTLQQMAQSVTYCCNSIFRRPSQVGFHLPQRCDSPNGSEAEHGDITKQLWELSMSMLRAADLNTSHTSFDESLAAQGSSSTPSKSASPMNSEAGETMTCKRNVLSRALASLRINKSAALTAEMQKTTTTAANAKASENPRISRLLASSPHSSLENGIASFSHGFLWVPPELSSEYLSIATWDSKAEWLDEMAAKQIVSNEATTTPPKSSSIRKRDQRTLVALPSLGDEQDPRALPPATGGSAGTDGVTTLERRSIRCINLLADVCRPAFSQKGDEGGRWGLRGREHAAVAKYVELFAYFLLGRESARASDVLQLLERQRDDVVDIALSTNTSAKDYGEGSIRGTQEQEEDELVSLLISENEILEAKCFRLRTTTYNV